MLCQSIVTRGVLCELVLLLLLVSTFKPLNFAMYSTTNGNEFCGVYRFVVVNFQEEERFLTGGRVSRGRVFVQQKCRIVAKLGIEHTSSFLMGFLCPTCGGRYDPRVFATIIPFASHSVRFAFWNLRKKNFMHFMRASCNVSVCLANCKSG